jgi:hypothetical protein
LGIFFLDEKAKTWIEVDLREETQTLGETWKTFGA